MSYKEPGLEERAAASARARTRALERLKAMPKPDEAELAAGAARQAERDAKAAEKRAAKAQGEREDRAKRLEARAAQAGTQKPLRTEAEKKEARDARYAARKSRKPGRR